MPLLLLLNQPTLPAWAARSPQLSQAGGQVRTQTATGRAASGLVES
jgi:hypothetical protein